ncbi:MAG: BON domain-containing protein [Rhodoferax sp.]
MHAKRWAILAAVLGGVVHADSGYRNWSNDPFFAVRTAQADCPLPQGPYTDEAGHQSQAHHRAERGTTCWLAGQCDRPHAYDYDPDIATDVQSRFAATSAFAQASLWVTVQGRIVYVDGCVAKAADADAIDALLRPSHWAQQIMVRTRHDPSAAPPYPVRREP